MSTLTGPRSEIPAELSNPGLVLLFGHSPNGWKCTYLLEALKQAGAIPDYTVCEVYLQGGQGGEQFKPWFKAINPNSKMPALIHNRPDKPPLKVFESASILLYLARTFDKGFKFHFEDDDLEQEMLDWVFWTQANLGPNQGNANHFYRYSDERHQYSTDRFITETKRLYQVLNDHLAGKEYLVGGKLSLADMCAEPWVRCHFWCGIPIAPYPHLEAWHDRIERLPVILEALKVPSQDLVTRIKNDPALEARIMEGMRKKKEEEREKAAARERGEGQE
ncbi:Glutathione S-transferase 2 [Rhodotorula kratochvilovae]